MICPLLAQGAMTKDGAKGVMDSLRSDGAIRNSIQCLEKNCAWFNEYENKCAIAKLAEAVGDISRNTE